MCNITNLGFCRFGFFNIYFAGQERFQSLGSSFYRGSEGLLILQFLHLACILVFDVTVLQTFYNLENWREDFITKTGIANVDVFPFYVVGNKTDMSEQRAVTAKQVQNWCVQKGGIPYFESSAKNGDNVEQIFSTIATSLCGKKDADNDELDTFKITNEPAAPNDPPCAC